MTKPHFQAQRMGVPKLRVENDPIYLTFYTYTNYIDFRYLIMQLYINFTNPFVFF